MSHPHTPHPERQTCMRVSEKFALHETTTHTKKPPPTQGGTPSRKPPSRCSQPLSTNQTPHPTTKAGQQQEPPTPRTNSRKPRAGTCHQRSRPAGLLSQSPIVCLMIPQSSVPTPLLTFVVHQTPPTTGKGFLTASGVTHCHNLFRGAP